MTSSTAPRTLAVAGRDPVELLATAAHQADLLPLIRPRPADAPQLDRTVHLLPVIGGAPRCEVRAGGHTIGELPHELAAEVHTGLLVLALLDPPYVVTAQLRLEWRERPGAVVITATALLDLEELRLLAS